MIGIYKITNPNNKIYIGQSLNIENRWNRYKKLQCKGQRKLFNSLKKYGWDKHNAEVIELCLENELLKRETYWKEYYKVLDTPSLCCKIDGKGGKLGKETCDLISNKKTNHPSFDDDWRKKQKDGKSKQKGIDFRSEQGKKNHKESMKNNTFRLGKKDTLETIQKRIQKTKGVAKGPQSEETKQKRSVKMKESSKTYAVKFRKPIIQLDKDGNTIKEWSSISEAVKELNLEMGTLVATLKGRQNTHKGWCWRYK